MDLSNFMPPGHLHMIFTSCWTVKNSRLTNLSCSRARNTCVKQWKRTRRWICSSSGKHLRIRPLSCLPGFQRLPSRTTCASATPPSLRWLVQARLQCVKKGPMKLWIYSELHAGSTATACRNVCWHERLSPTWILTQLSSSLMKFCVERLSLLVREKRLRE